MRMHKNLVCSSNLGNSECMIKDSRLLILENVIVYLLQIFSTITFSTLQEVIGYCMYFTYLFLFYYKQIKMFHKEIILFSATFVASEAVPGT